MTKKKEGTKMKIYELKQHNKEKIIDLFIEIENVFYYGVDRDEMVEEGTVKAVALVAKMSDMVAEGVLASHVKTYILDELNDLFAEIERQLAED